MENGALIGVVGTQVPLMPLEDQKAFVHALRVKIDECIIEQQKMKMFAFGQRESALVKTKLQEAKMWAGKILEEMGSELPPEFTDKASA